MSNQKAEKPAKESDATKTAPTGASKKAGAPATSGAPSHGQTNNVIPMKSAAAAKVGCLVLTCKSNDTRFGFCEEHFHQFKFGLITKTGQKVLDYEKKFEHYQSWMKVQKVA